MHWKEDYTESDGIARLYHGDKVFEESHPRISPSDCPGSEARSRRVETDSQCWEWGVAQSVPQMIVAASRSSLQLCDLTVAAELRRGPGGDARAPSI
jgi:hypothetical protein